MGAALIYERLEAFVLGLRAAGAIDVETECDLIDGPMQDAWIEMTQVERDEASARARRYNKESKFLGYVDVPVEIGATMLPRRRALPGELPR